MMRAISEKVVTGPRSEASQVSDRLVVEVQSVLSDLLTGLSNLSRLFSERFPPKPKYGIVRRVLQFVGDWYPIAIVAALVFFVLAIKLHWPWFFGWFGYSLGQVTVAKDVRNVFLIP